MRLLMLAWAILIVLGWPVGGRGGNVVADDCGARLVERETMIHQLIAENEALRSKLLQIQNLLGPGMPGPHR